ncbi:MAG: GIDE domain-containing protein [Elainellaceae cyanobacterium]
MLPSLLSSLVLLAFGALLFRRRQKLKQRLLAIKGTAVGRLGNLRQLVDQVAAEVGPGAYRERVALVGTIRCDAPLDATLSKQACVYCQTVVKEKYRETVTTTDSSGRRSRRSQRRTRVISRDVLHTPFYLEDSSGQVRIDPDRFDIEGVTVVQRFEPASPEDRRSRRAHSSTLGYHYHEDILPLGTTVYVIGELTDEGLELTLVAPTTPSSGIITYQSRQALTSKLEKSVRRRGWASAVLLVASISVLAFGLYRLL